MSPSAPSPVHDSTYLDSQGVLLKPLPAALADSTVLRTLYRAMVLTRAFDHKAVQLQRTGRLGTYPSCLGQEATAVGVGYAMREEDLLVPSFREQGTQLLRGVTMTELLLYWGGDERGSDFRHPREDFPISATVGGHAPHAAGVALAFKLRSEPRVAVCTFGDGATSKGDVYEAMNMAGVWQLPVVFVVTNNQWAISTPRSKQTAARTLAAKAVSAGFAGVQVDGNDVIAVTDTLSAALEHARSGNGPRLVECLTYRLGDHTTVDDASRYRNDEEVRDQWKNDPIARLRTYLTAAAGWSPEDEEQLLGACRAEVDSAAEVYLNTPRQPPESIFDYLYESLPPDLAAQRSAMLQGIRGAADA